MAFFGNPTSYVGIDIGTSSIKLVELVDRRRRIEVASYAQANLPNLLLDVEDSEGAAMRQVANVVSHMIDEAGVSSDVVVVALPSTIVFSSVLMLPDLPDQEMDKAVRFAARDIVPSDLDDMVLGWSRIQHKKGVAPTIGATTNSSVNLGAQTPVFLTAASKQVVDRYIKMLNMVNLKIEALEVETFPLARALLSGQDATALIIDIGDLATTFHIIDEGTPRVSHTIEYGGHHITVAIAKALNVPLLEAEEIKMKYGLGHNAPADAAQAIASAVDIQTQKAKTLLKLYQEKERKNIRRSFLIGGGANLNGLSAYWTSALGQPALIGNPWKGLSYPQELEKTLQQLAPNYAVAVGLALRKLKPEV